MKKKSLIQSRKSTIQGLHGMSHAVRVLLGPLTETSTSLTPEIPDILREVLDDSFRHYVSGKISVYDLLVDVDLLCKVRKVNSSKFMNVVVWFIVSLGREFSAKGTRGGRPRRHGDYFEQTVYTFVDEEREKRARSGLSGNQLDDCYAVVARFRDLGYRHLTPESVRNVYRRQRKARKIVVVKTPQF
jgi:hypothetical protein